MIESYIGTYENCISTIISLQNRDMGMIDMKQTDRKHFLSSILKLDILEQQYNSANQQYKEVDTEYKYLTKDLQPLKALGLEVPLRMFKRNTTSYELPLRSEAFLLQLKTNPLFF